MHFTIRHGGEEQIRVVATAVHAPGDLVVYGGFVGVFHGVKSCAIGDTINITLNATGDAVTASNVTFTAGDLVYWNTSTKTCVDAAGANIIKLGTAILAKTSGQLFTHVVMNRIPLA